MEPGTDRQCPSQAAKSAVTIAVIGSIAGYEPFYWGAWELCEYASLLAGITPGAIQYEPAIYILAVVMPALLCVSMSKTL
jgi:hypothetical protein